MSVYMLTNVDTNSDHVMVLCLHCVCYYDSVCLLFSPQITKPNLRWTSETYFYVNYIGSCAAELQQFCCYQYSYFNADC
jgi:hypothetical protein